MPKPTISNLTADVENIQKLEDLPNAVGNMTATQLKQAFDQAGTTIKDYINNTLVALLNGVGANSTDPGAKYVGVKAFTGVNVDNIQDALETIQANIVLAQTQNILDNAVTTPKLADGAVTTAKLDAKVVTTAKVDDGAITDTQCDFSSGLTVDGELDVNDVIVLTSDMYVPTIGDLPVNPKTGQLCFVKVS